MVPKSKAEFVELEGRWAFEDCPPLALNDLNTLPPDRHSGCASAEPYLPPRVEVLL